VNKKIVLSFAITGLLCLASLSFAVTISDPLGIGPDPNGWAILLGRIASGVGMVIASLGTIMIIIAGILYLISAGSPEKMTTAKKALIYAIVGIVIGITASTIANTVVSLLQGNPL
jgi:hypothetical protein